MSANDDEIPRQRYDVLMLRCRRGAAEAKAHIMIYVCHCVIAAAAAAAAAVVAVVLLCCCCFVRHCCFLLPACCCWLLCCRCGV